MVVPSKLFGRDVEAVALHELLDALPHAGGAVIISGDAGIGKTALAEFAIESAARDNIPVLSTSASEVEARVPFAALEDLLRSHIDALSLLRRRQREALKAALGISTSDTPDVYLVGLAVLDLLSEIGGNRGVLVVIDDVHWIDESTARVLGFVAQRLRSEPVAMILTMRPGYATPLLDFPIPTLDLPTLCESNSLALMADARPGLARSEQRRVVDLARGNPLALLELPPEHEHPAEAGHLMTQRLQRAFAVQFSDLSRRLTIVLLVAAISDSGAVREIIDAARLCGAGADVNEDALDDVAATRALTVYGGVVRFRHPLVRSAIVESARATELRAAHAALARTLEGSSDRAA
ncbi:MAG: ATP-binding protein, partial [Microbacteriaceae bacterium]